MSLQPRPPPREATYGDDAAIRRIDLAADHLKSAIMSCVADADRRGAAIKFVEQAQEVALSAIAA